MDDGGCVVCDVSVCDGGSLVMGILSGVEIVMLSEYLYDCLLWLKL